MRLISLAIFGFIAATSSSAFAEECDPYAILRKDVERYNEHIAVFMAQLDAYNESIKAGHKADAGFTYDGFPITANDAGTFARQVQRQTGFKLDRDQSVSILRATLSDNNVRAYERC